MFALGQKRAFAPHKPMSAFPQNKNLSLHRNVGFEPTEEIFSARLSHQKPQFHADSCQPPGRHIRDLFHQGDKFA
jgi:hypothetical protein